MQVALAPAGSGKTMTLGVLAWSWEASGGKVVGPAPTAVAADQLGRAAGILSETLAKFLHEVNRSASDANSFRRPGDTVKERGIGLDEAAMAGTRELVRSARGSAPSPHATGRPPGHLRWAPAVKPRGLEPLTPACRIPEAVPREGD